ncbi:MAG: hypothetical protein Q4C04_01945 [Clostridia bacterium]|nr:hypothetical protein [Clostridia bacterium]
MKKPFKLAFIALLCAFCLLLSGCRYLIDAARDFIGDDSTPSPAQVVETTPSPTASAGEEEPSPQPTAPLTEIVFPDVQHGEVNFSDMVFTYPDMDALIADIEAVQAEYDSGANPEECLSKYDELCERYNQASSQCSLAYILYCLDVNNETMQKNYEDLTNALSDAEWRLVDLGVSMVEDPSTSDAFSSEYVDSITLADGLNDESIQGLIEQETSLCSEYEEFNTGFTLSYGGVEYTLDDIYALEDYELYSTLRTLYLTEFNETAGSIFVELIDVRTQIADILGYDSYTEYRYDCYERDFTPEDALAFADDVKTYIVPVYRSLLIYNYYFLMDTIYEAEDYQLEPTMEAIRESISDLVPELLPAWDYMIEYDLYNFDVSDAKMPGSYTTIISEYNAPFMYSHWDGSYTTISTIVHEFGHYANFYFNPGSSWVSDGSLDLAEVDSQALELLMLTKSEELYGTQYADGQRIDAVLTALVTLMSACMEDEFQQYAYAHPDATLEELNAEYYRLSTEYGFADLYLYSGLEWATIHHHFQLPMYYISYATSMLGALQVFEYSLDDYDAALNIYLQIQTRSSYSKFRETLMNAGLSDPFSDDVVLNIANAVTEYVDSINSSSW